MAIKDKNIEGLNNRVIVNNITAFAQNKTPDTFKQNTAKIPDANMVWCAVQFLTNTTCSEIKEIVGGVSTAVTALAIAYTAGTTIYGQFTSVTGDNTGTVRAYYYTPIN